MCQALFQEVIKQIKIRCHLHYVKKKQYVIGVKYYRSKSVPGGIGGLIWSKVNRKDLTKKKFD